MADEFLFIAKIQSVGKSGFVKVQLIPGFFDSLKKIKYLFLDFWNQKKKFELEEIVTNKTSVFLKFNNFDDERNASVLLNKDIYVQSSLLKELDLNIILEKNVIGFKVLQNHKVIGVIKDFYEAPANPIIELDTESGREILVPFVDDVIEIIDYQKKELVVKPDFGLEDDED